MTILQGDRIYTAGKHPKTETAYSFKNLNKKKKRLAAKQKVVRDFRAPQGPSRRKRVRFGDHELCSSHHLLKSEDSEAFREGSGEGVGRRLVEERDPENIFFGFV